MSLDETSQLPLRIKRKARGRTQAQFAALCWRILDGQTQVCLVTTRGKRRWTLPKGWPMNKQTPAEAAATEAYEEAGLTGRAQDRCLGVYSYLKPGDKSRRQYLALVFPVEIEETHDDWPERRDRQREWLPQAQAAARLSPPELRHIVEQFDPQKLRAAP